MTPPVVPSAPPGWARAVSVLEAGGIVAIPTDTVYGVAVSLATPGGVERLFAVKERPPEKGIVALVDDLSQVVVHATVTAGAEALRALWPGGLTLVLPLRPGAPIPAAMTGGSTTLGVRIPDHPAPREIARALGPLPTTSANLSGQPEALTAAAVLEALGERIDLVVDGGPARGGVPSTVVDVSGTTARLLREGAIGRGEIAAILEAAGIPVDPGG